MAHTPTVKLTCPYCTRPLTDDGRCNCDVAYPFDHDAALHALTRAGITYEQVAHCDDQRCEWCQQ